MKRFLLVLILLIPLIPLTSGCGYSNELSNTEDTTKIFGTRFQRIEGRDDLVFDIDTKNVFYLFSIDSDVNSQIGIGRGFFGEYIGNYGYPCKYVDGIILEFKEIDGKIIYFSPVSP